MKFLQQKTRRLAVPDGKLFLKSDIKHKDPVPSYFGMANVKAPSHEAKKKKIAFRGVPSKAQCIHRNKGIGQGTALTRLLAGYVSVE